MGDSIVKYRTRTTASLAVIVMALQFPGNAGAVDWGKVSGKDIPVFYPGQSSWEWILTQSDHEGAKDIRKGKRCWDCHEGEEKEIGSKTVSGETLEPKPVPGKRPAFDLNVKASHDGENLYLRLAWSDDGISVEQKEDPDYQAKVTVLIGDKSMVAFDRGGCWATCHDDLTGMPSEGSGERTKYLADSRTKITRQGGGDAYKSDDELAKLLAEGTFIEFWQARLKKDAVVPVDGYILEKIHKSESPAISVEGGFQDGRWTVVFSRKLKANGNARRQFESGDVIHLGIAIHDDYAKGRRHHVSFKNTLSVGKGDADIVAVKQ